MIRELIMKSEPLKGCKQFQPSLGGNYFSYEHVKSAVAGLIEFHEDCIEELIHEIEFHASHFPIDDPDDDESEFNYKLWVSEILDDIQKEYESIMAIEHWLEDAL
jgi:hypothetical protein